MAQRFFGFLLAGAIYALIATGFVLTSDVLTPLDALAQSECPSGAHRAAVIPAESRVRLIGLSSADAYYGDRNTIVGKVGRIDQFDNTGPPDCWFGGQFYGDDGTSYYFYQVAVEILGGAAPAGGSCPGNAFTGASVPSGQQVKLLTVHPEDAYYSTKGSIEGKLGRTDGTWSKMGEACWFAGQFYGDDGSSNYFYKVSVEFQSGASCPSSAYTGGSVSSGSRVKILTVSPDDAYYSSKWMVENISGRADGSWSKTGEPCWYAGQFYGDGGESFYFYQAALEFTGSVTPPPVGAACPPGAMTAASTPHGTRVKLVGIHPDDAYYSMTSTMIGLSGKVDGDIHSNDGCWMGGGFIDDSGADYYFYKGAFVPLGGGTPTTPTVTGDRFMGDSIPGGTRFRIVALNPEDAYYPDRATIIGKTCTADEVLSNQDKGWYSGPVTCTDGSTHYFFKVGVVFTY